MSDIGDAAAAMTFLTFASSALQLYGDLRLESLQLHSEFRLRLEIEAIIFDRWCSDVGVQRITEVANANPRTWPESVEFIDFRSQLRSELRLYDWPLGVIAVGKLKTLNKKIENTRGLIPSAAPTTSKLFRHQNPGGIRNGAIDPKVSITLYRKARWLAWGKKNFRKLLDDIAAINVGLQGFLDKEQQNQLKRRVHLQVLNTEYTNSVETMRGLPSSVDGGQELSILVRLRDVNVREDEIERKGRPLGTEEADIEINESSSLLVHGRVRHFRVDDLENEALKVGPLRVLSFLGQGQGYVLIEWKGLSSTHLRANQVVRLASLVDLLGSNDVHKKFQIPACRGLVEDSRNNRIGVVYGVPRVNTQDATALEPELSDLQSWIRETEIAPLGYRFMVAKQLATAVHHLHSVSWLHKAIRSDNIVAFLTPSSTRNRNVGEKPAHPISADSHHQTPTADNPARWPENISLPSNLATKVTYKQVESPILTDLSSSLPAFYLLGLEFSRPDHPGELSEAISISKPGDHHKNENIQLYSHPRSLQINPDGKSQRFCSEYDIYSLGVILLEIGLWRTASSLKREALEAQQPFEIQLCGTVCDRLRPSMGEEYWRATHRCLNNDFDFGDIQDDTEEGLKLQLAFEKQVLSVLEGCSA